MNTIRQNVRPKHQGLVLKCYPRFQKNVVEVKPNSSELSYLLYYASTRRSKLQKVGAFLEKKTLSDVWRLRPSNVQVTLQIVKALIEKCPRDLPLYSDSVLNILDAVLKSQDPILVEESVATFEAFVSHYETATLAADVGHARQFQDIVQQYARFASKEGHDPMSVPLAIRYRTSGLLAIKALVSSSAFVLDAARHSNTIIPAVLDNTYSDQASYLALLQYRENAKEKTEKEMSHRKRPSMSMPRSTMDVIEGDPLAALGTTADLDQKAEEEVGVLALQCLRRIFQPDNRNAIRIATGALIAYSWTKRKATDEVPPAQPKPARKTWTSALFELVCQWTPVQDRFMILVTIMEALIHSPIKESDVLHQLFLVDLIDSLLRSSVNLIGLSVMDVLLGLVQHVLLVLQLGGASSKVTPHQQQASPVTPAEDTLKVLEPPLVSSPVVDMEITQTATAPRILLVERLRTAIGDLATHIYYADQISDMVAALLMRLKPSPTPAMPSVAAAIADPSAAADAVATSVNLSEKPHTDGFFSFDTARLLALDAVRDIIVVANSRRRDGNNPSGRNPVDVSAWNGTQWLLRDSDPKVRRAYVEALLTWLNLETGKGNLQLIDTSARNPRTNKQPNEQSSNSLSRRAVSNASQRTLPYKAVRSSFLQLLHLAIYEHAMQCAESESDILLLHLLLTQSVNKLGVNSVRAGLPMIFRLQEDIQDLPTPEGKVCVGSLVHGYFWALSEYFEFETSSVGRAIFLEIERRTKAGAWLENVHVPPLPLAQIPTVDPDRLGHHIDARVAATASLKPFDGRDELVESIAEAYSILVLSPPNSPPTSPSRGFSSGSLRGAVRASSRMDQSLPVQVKEELLAEWTKDDCIAAAERELHRANSLTGSRVGSTSGKRQHLSANGAHTSNDTLGLEQEGSRPRTPFQDGLGGSQRFSPVGSTGTHTSESDKYSVVRVSHLKEVLAGTRSSVRPNTGYVLDDADDTASDSLVSIDASASNVSLPFTDASNTRNTAPTDLRDPGTANIVTEPSSRKSSIEKTRAAATLLAEEDIPPVPMLPAASQLGAKSLAPDEPRYGLHSARSSLMPNRDSNGGYQLGGYGDSPAKVGGTGKMDLQLLLSGAKMPSRPRPMSSAIGRPPY